MRTLNNGQQWAAGSLNETLAVKTMRTLVYFIFIALFVISFTVNAEGVGEKFTSFTGFELGAVRLADIQNKLGQVKILETGDAGEYTASVCYIVPHGVVLFFAGELDGQERNLGGFGFAKKTDRLPCLKWPAAVVAPDLVIGGLRLGLSVTKFTNIVGAPIQMEGNKAYAFFEGKRIMTNKEILRLPVEIQAMIKSGKQQNYFDVVVSIVAIFTNGHLTKLRIWKTETI